MIGINNILSLLLFFLVGCTWPERPLKENVETDTLIGREGAVIDSQPLIPTPPPFIADQSITTGSTTPTELVAYAKTLVGIKYKYASTNPAEGFDCSGFINYVFNHFGIAVPRSSVDFTNAGTTIDEKNAAAGDLVLFTGTDSLIRIVGHMGIVTENNNGQILFIHSSSGKANGVIITPMERYYRSRFVKIVRVFPERYF